jgi:hypothetical protein
LRTTTPAVVLSTVIPNCQSGADAEGMGLVKVFGVTVVLVPQPKPL